MPIPGAKASWIRDHDSQVLFLEILKAIGALVLVGLTAPKLIDDQRTRTALGVVSTGGTICMASALAALAAWRQKREKKSMHDLDGCLHTLHAVLNAVEPPDVDAGLRVALHVPKKRKKGSVRLEQATDYICNDSARAIGKGRRFSAHTGLIGQVYREQRIGTVERVGDSYEDFINEMVTKWNYTPSEARQLDGAVMSNMAVPLVSSERGVEAIVYLDSMRRDFFTKARQDLVEGACLGIAVFVGRRYN